MDDERRIGRLHKNCIMTGNKYDSATAHKSSAAVQVFIAGLSNSSAAVVTNPFDVVKIRLQMHGVCMQSGLETVAGHHQLGVVDGFSTVLKTDGLNGMYRGLQASVCREMSYSGLTMGLYEPTKQMLCRTFYSEDQNNTTPLALKMFSGGLTGCVGSALANPFDIVKCRMQTADGTSGRTSYTSIMSALRHIHSEGGIRRGLWRGTSATVQRAIFVNASQVPSYDHVKHFILDRGYMKEGYLCHFVCSMVAGVVAAAVTSPVDLVKSRLMIQPVDPITGKGSLYTGTMDCFLRVVRSEGTQALFKGFHMQWMRLGPHTTISLMTFEELRRLFGMDYL